MSLEPSPFSAFVAPDFLLLRANGCTSGHQATRPPGLAQCFTRGSRTAWETAKEEGWEGKKGRSR